MKQKIAHIALLVADYDEAISFYVDKLHFDLIEDTACQADLVVLVFGLIDNFSHELLRWSRAEFFYIHHSILRMFKFFNGL